MTTTAEQEYDEAFQQIVDGEPPAAAADEPPDAPPVPPDEDASGGAASPDADTAANDEARLAALEARATQAEERARKAEERYSSFQGIFQQRVKEEAEKLAQPKPEGPSDDDLYQQYEKAVEGGDGRMAAQLLRQINDRRAPATGAEDAVRTAEQRISEFEWKQALKEACSVHPQIDANAKEANPQAISLVQRVMNGYVKEGMGWADALRKAVEDILPLFPDTRADPTGTLPPTGPARQSLETVKSRNTSPPKGSPNPDDYEGAWDEITKQLTVN